MAKNKREMAFTTEFKRPFKKRGHFFYKIPDSPSAMKFMISKPFDAFACVDGLSVAMEIKVLKGYQAFGMRHLRPNQIEGLEKHSKSGQSYVILEVHAGRGDYRLLFWRWDVFKDLCEKNNGSIKKPLLESMPFEQTNGEGYELNALFESIDYSKF